ncbi:replication fork protection component Swi3-domain-containing protein [Bisporella sp. PMI_857]|nr:replication fork protection component Swi3-domain-containing protein [Bisporella sp. PMI_857]
MAPLNTASKPLPSGEPTVGGDEFDDLFDYDIDDQNDPFSDNYNLNNTNNAAKDSRDKDTTGAALGIDEEVEVTRKPRAPRVKLDENRLLSDAGIPKLRKKAKHHLKFKGKGHEYSDCDRLLSFYQLWLDDLFPKAKFLDALNMVEKMGHKKRMQMMRMEWINEGKPRSSVHEDSLFDQPETARIEDGEREKAASRIAPIFEKNPTEKPKTPEPGVDADMEDLYGATPKATRREPADDSQDSLFGGRPSIFGNSNNAHDGPPEDDLDALLAEEERMQIEKTTQSKPRSQPVVEENFDDLDALMAEEEMMQADIAKQPAVGHKVTEDAVIDEDMEAMAAEMGDDMW